MARTVAEQLLTDDMDDEEKLRAIYGYIVEHTTYDYRYYQDPGAMPFESRTAYGPLAEGTAICGGFSWAFRMLCEEAGIPCWNVTGTGAGEEHMWNCALMGGEYRYFDTTWDAGATDEEQWRYFACTEAEMTQNHQWGQGQEELLHALTDTKK
nr:transglutaminase domain-containing protein [Pseudoflavonifractor phocaeensis]